MFPWTGSGRELLQEGRKDSSEKSGGVFSPLHELRKLVGESAEGRLCILGDSLCHAMTPSCSGCVWRT